MIESIALCSIPLITGSLVQSAPDLPTGYRRSSLFFVCFSIIAILVAGGLLWVPDKIKRKLDRCSHEKLIG